MSLKIFSHRGIIGKNSQENTLNSLKKAYKNDFRALEFDIWFVKNQLVLRHNRPNDNLNHLTKLSEVFAEFGNEVEYWLDFKNLNTRNCKSALKAVKTTTKNLKIKSRQIYFAPFILDFKKAQKIYAIIRKYFGKKIKILAVLSLLKKDHYQEFYQKLKTENIFGLSIQHRNINPEFRKIFHDIEIFAWTVNKKTTHDFMEEFGVENIATDKLRPKKINFEKLI
ncbi:MAG: glycerophosphoryl diester phosphodiesterase [Rickettsiales bacterium]|jgi:glycerophosphoryl diester phosphodiesterase